MTGQSEPDAPRTPPARARRGAGGRLSPVRLQPGAALRRDRLGAQHLGRRRDPGRGRRRRGGGVSRGSAARNAAPRLHRRARRRAGRGGGRRSVRHPGERRRPFRLPARLARHRHLRRLPPRAARADRPALSLPLHELHQLRPAVHHHRRPALRPRAHHHAGLSDVPSLPPRVHRPDGPALSRRTQRLSGLRAAGDADRCCVGWRRRRTHGSPTTADGAARELPAGAPVGTACRQAAATSRSPRRRGCCARGRSWRSRASAAFTWPAMPPTRRRCCA